MAVETLFHSSVTTLKQSMRLSGAVQTDSLTIIDEAIKEVRIGFYEYLGSNRVAHIKTNSLVDNPTTSGEILRSKAAQTESAWVRLLLLRRLPSLFTDGGGNAQQVWNEEAFVRQLGKSDTEREIERLFTEVQNNLAALAGGGETDQSTVQIDVIGPTENTTPYLGSSVIPGSQLY